MLLSQPLCKALLRVLLNACKTPANCSRQQPSHLPFCTSAERPAIRTGHMPAFCECPGIMQLISTLALVPALDSSQREVGLLCTLAWRSGMQLRVLAFEPVCVTVQGHAAAGQ